MCFCDGDDSFDSDWMISCLWWWTISYLFFFSFRNLATITHNQIGSFWVKFDLWGFKWYGSKIWYVVCVTVEWLYCYNYLQVLYSSFLCWFFLAKLTKSICFILYLFRILNSFFLVYKLRALFLVHSSFFYLGYFGFYHFYASDISHNNGLNLNLYFQKLHLTTRELGVSIGLDQPDPNTISLIGSGLIGLKSLIGLVWPEPDNPILLTGRVQVKGQTYIILEVIILKVKPISQNYILRSIL